VEDYLQSARDGCSPAQWTRAVKAARTGKVHGVREVDGELIVRVETLPGLPAHSVSLEPKIGSWDCDCDARTDACEHVAAAVIVYARAHERGEPMPGLATGNMTHVGYRLRSRRGPIKLRRVLVGLDGEQLMPASLAKLDGGKVPGAPPFTADKADRAFETRFGPSVKAKIPPRLMGEVIDHLSRVSDVKLDGRPVSMGSPSSGLIVRVSETKAGDFVARIEQDPEVTELYENGAFRRARTLHAIGPHGLEARLFDELRKGMVFSSGAPAPAPIRGRRKGPDFAGDVGALVGQILPVVRRQLPVSIDTSRLPGSVKIRPRIQLNTIREGDALAVLATLVYGDPPIARVDGERLRLVGKGGGARALPVRNARVEDLLRTRLRERFGLEVGVRKILGATEAIALGAILGEDQQDFQVSGDAHEGFFEAAALEPKLVMGADGAFELYFVPEGAEFDPANPGSGSGSGGDADEFGGLDDDEHPQDMRAQLQGLRGQGGRRFRRANAAAVVQAWQAGEAFAPLLGGGFGQIPTGFMGQHGHLVADLLAASEASAAEKGNTTAGRAALLDLAELAAALDQAPPPGFEQLAALVGDFAGIPTATLPEGLQADLRDYQSRGVDWLTFIRNVELGALLADDMGLGKTLQALCVLRSGEDSDGHRRQNLVVCPTSVLHNWRVEIDKFRPGLRASVYHGPQRRLDDDADVILTTYAILRIDIERLLERPWDAIVLDEAQAIKNPTSKVARAAFRLRARFKMALTGTPVENHLEDLWSQFHFLQPGLLGGRSQFHDRYVKPIELGDRGAAQRLRRRIRPFVLRRLKSEVATELPPRTDVVLRCELSVRERQVYDAVRAATQEQVVDRLQSGHNVLQVLEALLRLRQAACHPALLPGGRGRAALDDNDAAPSSSKIDLLLETLREVIDGGHKALVFSQWTSLLNLLEPVLDADAITYCRLDGGTRDRQGVVEQFQSPGGPPVMLISLKAGGTGLNLTAADNVFLLDPWWNPAVEDQAADRAHRIGQDKPVLVHRLIASDTVEERILGLQDRKRKLAQTAVGDASGAHAVTKDELLALLE